MKKREIAEEIEKQPYFETITSISKSEQYDGTRELRELDPFLISGGKNTERYYFMHINDKTDYKFNIKPKYFGDESSYTEVFPKRIKEILNVNNDAKIFCVFDWDTIYENIANLKKQAAFEQQFHEEISNGIVVLCPSMPSIEYWFLLHFIDETKLLKSCNRALKELTPYLKPYFAHPEKSLKKLLKSEKYLKDTTWVERLCADGKLEDAIGRSEKNIVAATASGELEKQSYSYVFRVFKR